MSVRVDVPPYRQMVYSANGGSRLAGAAASSKQRISKDAAGRAQAATTMGPLGIVKSKASAARRRPSYRPICQTLTDDLPSFFPLSADESDSGIGLCGWLLTMISWGIVAVTLPFSLFVCFKVRDAAPLRAFEHVCP